MTSDEPIRAFKYALSGFIKDDEQCWVTEDSDVIEVKIAKRGTENWSPPVRIERRTLLLASDLEEMFGSLVATLRSKAVVHG